MTALFNCLDEPFGAVHLFAGIEQRLLVLSAHALLILLIAFEQIGKRRRHIQIRHPSFVDIERDSAIVGSIYYEVGRDLLQVPSFCLPHRSTWLGVQLLNLRLQLPESLFVEVELLSYLVPMLVHEIVEVLGNQRFHQLSDGC